MFWFCWSNKSITLSFFILKSPFFTKIIYNFFAFNFSDRHLSLISFTTASRCLSNSIMNFMLSLLILVKHSVRFLWFFNCNQWFRSTSISHSLFNKRWINSFLFKDFFEFLHTFIFLMSSSVSFKSMLLSKSMFFLLYFLISFLNLWFYKSLLILLYFHAFHLH